MRKRIPKITASSVLVHDETGQQLKIGQRITITAPCKLKGRQIVVNDIQHPKRNYPEGLIIYSRMKGGWQQIIPSIANYIWAEPPKRAEEQS